MSSTVAPAARTSARALMRRVAVAAAVALSLCVLLATPLPRSAASTAASCGPRILKTDGSAWTCTFDDEFSASAVDTSAWTVGTTKTTGFYQGRTCMTADNVVESGGTLKVSTKRVTPFVCSSPYKSFTTNFTGGHIASTGKFAQTYGRFEVRARYPRSGKGVHGGFWMYPNKMTYGAWPDSGELDVAEWWSNAPQTVLPSLIYNGSDYSVDSGWNCTVADPTAWHTYAVVWLDWRMQFSIDGQPCFTRSWTPNAPQKAPQPFDQPFALVLTMATDNSRTNSPDSSTKFPATYEIDYARAWQ